MQPHWFDPKRKGQIDDSYQERAVILVNTALKVLICQVEDSLVFQPHNYVSAKEGKEK